MKVQKTAIKMFKSPICLCVLGLIYLQVFTKGAFLNDEEHLLQKWKSFKVQYNKQYKTVKEEELRMKIYFDNEMKIAQHKKRFRKGEETYEQGTNHFSDLTQHEFAELYFFKFDPNLNISEDGCTREERCSPQRAPSEKNWIRDGKVTPVKNQLKCGCCWAFAAAAAIETHIAIKTGTFPQNLSEQNLLDCVGQFNNCNGGFPSSALDYVRLKNGIATDSSYPYHAKQEKCRYDEKSMQVARINGCRRMITKKCGEDEMKQFVGTRGPVTCILARSDLLRNHKSGIYSVKNCHFNSEQISENHALAIVGYGIENGQDYWLVKNSWGTDWGEQGYGKIARNMNMCGIADFVYYPVVN